MTLNKTINLDHQASTPVDNEVLEVVFEEFKENPGNPHSDAHVLGWKASASVDKATQHISSMLSVDPDEIIFTSGATEANNLAIVGMGLRARETERQRILSFPFYGLQANHATHSVDVRKQSAWPNQLI